MKLSELITACGDDKVEFQNLDQCLISVDFNAKRGSKITFGTSMTVGLDGPDKLGLIVWLDRETVAAAAAAAKQALENSPATLADATNNEATP